MGWDKGGEREKEGIELRDKIAFSRKGNEREKRKRVGLISI